MRLQEMFKHILPLLRVDNNKSKSYDKIILNKKPYTINSAPDRNGLKYIKPFTSFFQRSLISLINR